MKTNKFILSVCISLGLVFSSCSSFLDTEPMDSLTEVTYFKTLEQFQYAANNLHQNVYAWNQGNTSYEILFDFGTDIIARTSPAVSGTNSAGTTDPYWSQTYNWLRTVNQLIEKGDNFTGADNISGPMGQAYFFRAWHHFFLLKRFGGVPIANKVTTEDADIVWGKRASRYEVVAQIISDLDTAIVKLSKTTVATTGNDGHITLEAAKALKARVCLFEGTWEKYVGTTTDGDGTTVGTGSVKPAVYPTVTGFLTMAKDLSKEVIDGAKFELWKGVETVTVSGVANKPYYANSSYFYLFNLEDGASNPNGLGKASNKESIYRSVFDYTNRKGSMNLSHTKPATPSRKLMDMFLCTDGLPVQYSPNFQGYANMKDEFKNRDYRLASCVKEPFKFYWGFGKTSNGAVYTVDLTTKANTSTYFYSPALRASGQTGYEGRKFSTERSDRSTDSDESQDYMHIRLPEIYLIYAEATCELGNGSISDADLDYSINKVRARAGVAPLSMALIAPYSDLTLLGEIRRERALELFGEGQRISDLCRWGIAEQDMAGAPICGVYVSYNGIDTEYKTAVNPSDNKNVFNASAFDASSVTSAETSVSSYAGIAKIKAGAVISEKAENRVFARKNYLQPIPTDQIKLNPNLKQNPNW